jgi:hypothetical protein
VTSKLISTFGLPVNEDRKPPNIFSVRGYHGQSNA